MRVPLSDKDQELFREVVQILHGLQYAATYYFLFPEAAHKDKDQDKDKGKTYDRKMVAKMIRDASRVFVDYFGCGEGMCPDKNGTCIGCPPENGSGHGILKA